MSAKRTPFYDIHVSLNAKMVEFAGYDMPLQYETGSTREHQFTRTDVGAFDVSHMGEFEITGPDRNAFANRITCNDVANLQAGQVQYSALLTEEGTFVDDLLVYRFDDRIMLVVNAGNIQKDWEHILARKSGINCRIKDNSDSIAMLAIQGPKAEELISALASPGISDLGYYHFDAGQIAGSGVFVSRTGYTGEDGFEIYCRNDQASVLWHGLVGHGRAQPVGLAARDSLRLEMGYSLYGHEIDENINPYEAGLGWIVKPDKGAPFTGRAAVQAVKAAGPSRKMVGFTCSEKGAIPRDGYDVFLGGEKTDHVRSGGFSPSLDSGIGTTFLPADSAVPGTKIEIAVRDKRVEGEVVALPFYKDGTVKSK
jgi:aminomethyltransferase